MNNDYQRQIDEARDWLQKNPEWKNRYSDYASKLLDNISKIEKLKRSFHQWGPLYLYMNVSMAKSGANVFNLRFCGQDVADIKFNGDEVLLNISKTQEKNNLAHFSLNFQHGTKLWNDKDAQNFRKFFQNYHTKNRNTEHMLESMLLTELEKDDANVKNSSLYYIRPIKFADICRFQMPTPFTASNPIDLKYAKSKGGGIDILARIGRGSGTKICVMELKKEFTTTNKPMLQAISYAVFIQELLDSDCGKYWYKLFGFNGELKENMPLKVCTVMPGHATKESLVLENIETEQGILELRSMYINKDWAENGITSVKSNIFEKN